jgi:hypothetical protein
MAFEFEPLSHRIISLREAGFFYETVPFLFSTLYPGFRFFGFS